MEKPLAPTGDEAWDLVRRARRADRILCVGHLLRYHPAVERLARLVRDGRLGRLYYLTAQRTNLGRIRTDESALTSLGPHDVSVMVHLTGAWPVAVAARGAAYVQPHWEDVVFLELLFPGGVMGHLHLSWLDPHKVRRLSLVGSRRMAVFDDMAPRDKLVIHDKGAHEEAPVAPQSPVTDAVPPPLQLEPPPAADAADFVPVPGSFGRLHRMDELICRTVAEARIAHHSEWQEFCELMHTTPDKK